MIPCNNHTDKKNSTARKFQKFPTETILCMKADPLKKQKGQHENIAMNEKVESKHSYACSL